MVFPATPSMLLRLLSFITKSKTFVVSNFDQTAIAFKKFGDGYIGYIGDVNIEQGSNVVFAMCSTYVMSLCLLRIKC